MRANTPFRRRVFAFAVATMVGIALTGLQMMSAVAEGPSKAKPKPAASPGTGGTKTALPPAAEKVQQTPAGDRALGSTADLDLNRTKQGRRDTTDEKAATTPSTGNPEEPKGARVFIQGNGPDTAKAAVTPVTPPIDKGKAKENTGGQASEAPLLGGMEGDRSTGPLPKSDLVEKSAPADTSSGPAAKGAGKVKGTIDSGGTVTITF